MVFSALPVPLRIVTTWVDRRLTEAYCTTEQAVERIVASPESWRDGSEEGTIVAWLRDGRIVHDRDLQLAAAQERVRREPSPFSATYSEIYEARRKIAYNVAQLQRYLAADDPVSTVVVDLRLLYSVFEVALHYFTVRRLPWRGEKAAVRYWSQHDPGFLELLRQCLVTLDPHHKAEIYEELARRTLAPVGGLWGIRCRSSPLEWPGVPEQGQSPAVRCPMHAASGNNSSTAMSDAVRIDTDIILFCGRRSTSG